MKIGLFFGTFNPIHVGHLMIASYMAQRPELDQVWMVVSPQNPHKIRETLLADYLRLDLVNRAIEDDPRLRASDIEFRLSKPSYTVHTLAHLKEKYPDYQFSLIMGEDNLRSLDKWLNHEYILQNHQIFVYPRVITERETEGIEEKNQFVNHPSITFCSETPLINISSSFIRKQIKDGQDVRYLLNDPVYRYVDEMNLFK